MNQICPYCQNEMEKGIVQTAGNNLFWDKNPKHNLFYTVPSKQGIKLSYRPIGGAYIENAYCCKKCNTIMFQYDKEFRYFV